MSLDPRSAAVLANRAAARIQQKEFATALEDCEAAIRMDESYVKAYVRAGLCTSKLGRWDDAERFYTQAMLRDPMDASVRSKRDAAVLARRRFEAAQAALAEGERAQEAGAVEEAVWLRGGDGRGAGGASPDSRAMDADGSGAVSVDEFRTAMRGLRIELERIASNERIKNMEFSMMLNIAEVEGNAQIATAALEGLANTITSTGNLIGELFGLLVGGEATQFQDKILQQIEAEQKEKILSAVEAVSGVFDVALDSLSIEGEGEEADADYIKATRSYRVEYHSGG